MTAFYDGPALERVPEAVPFPIGPQLVNGKFWAGRQAMLQIAGMKAKAARIGGYVSLDLSRDGSVNERDKGLRVHSFWVQWFPPEDFNDRRMYDVQEDWGFVRSHTFPYRMYRLQVDGFGSIRTSYGSDVEAREFLKRYWRDFASVPS